VKADAPAGRDPQAARFSEGYKSLVLTLLALAYALNFIDRTIIAVIGQAIKVDLKLSDAQLGLLGGLAFVVLYSAAGLPIARLAERRSRVNIISVAVLLWSGCTALCGAAANYAMLIAFRIFVGVGEAGLSSPAHSLISDYFKPKQRAGALGRYGVGISVGGMIGAAAGGWVAQHLSWRAAFLLVGLPGVAAAAAIKWLVREPPRGWSQAEAAETAPAPLGAPPPILAVARRLFGTWSTLNALIGITLVGFATYGTMQYQAPYFIRAHGLDLASAGLLLGLIAGVSNGAGTLAGGALADWIARRNLRFYTILPAVGLLVSTPLMMLAYTSDGWAVAAALLFAAGLIQYLYIAPTFAVFQDTMGPLMRATAAAMANIVVTFLAQGFGPPFCGFLIDHFAGVAFNAAGGIGDFVHACPGGIGPEGAGAAIDAACKASMAHGTRIGLVVILVFNAWGALHYLLAALTLPRDVERAQTELP